MKIDDSKGNALDLYSRGKTIYLWMGNTGGYNQCELSPQQARELAAALMERARLAEKGKR